MLFAFLLHDFFFSHSNAHTLARAHTVPLSASLVSKSVTRSHSSCVTISIYYTLIFVCLSVGLLVTHSLHFCVLVLFLLLEFIACRILRIIECMCMWHSNHHIYNDREQPYEQASRTDLTLQYTHMHTHTHTYHTKYKWCNALNCAQFCIFFCF